MVNRQVFAPAVAIALFFGSCTSAPARISDSTTASLGAQATPSPSPSASPLPSREEADFRKAHGLYASGNYDAALVELDLFKSRYPKGSLIPQAENLTGLCYLLTKRPKQAVNYFKMALRGTSSAPNFNQHVLYNQAKAEFDADFLDDAQGTLQQIDPKTLERDTKVKYHFLKSNLLLKRSQFFESARELLGTSRLLDSNQARELRPSFVASLDQSTQKIPNSSMLTDLYKEFEDSPYADHLLFRLASREQMQGDTRNAELHFKTLTEKFPQSEHAAQASASLQAREPEAAMDPAAVGILVPTKGKFAKFGARTIQGIELAFRIFDHSRGDSKVTLVIEDSGEEPEAAIKALNRLVTKHHVAAVIGPLLTKGIDAVTKRAQELRIPLLTLARQSGTPGDYIIPSGLTLQLQAYEVARHAIQKMDLKRFAIVSPKDRVGEEFTQYFWDAVEALGGEINGFEAYNPGDTDFRQTIDKLSGLYYTEARQPELDELARLREVNQIRKKTRKTEQYYSLKPIVDYQAVFVPDEPKMAGQILPTFAYRDVDKIIFLGPSAWNSPEFPQRAQSYAEKSYFADAFFAESQSPEVKRFVADYKAVFDQEPTAMEALAYDAARVLEEALLKSGKAQSRNDVLAALKSVKDHSGVTGKISFKDGQLFRDLRILTVKGGQVVEATRP